MKNPYIEEFNELNDKINKLNLKPVRSRTSQDEADIFSFKYQKEYYERNIKAFDKLTSAQQLAWYIHKFTCHSNHIDYCSFYSYNLNDWTDYSKVEYLKKAERLLEQYSDLQVFEILSIVYKGDY